jgi:hypothetical protein
MSWFSLPEDPAGFNSAVVPNYEQISCDDPGNLRESILAPKHQSAKVDEKSRRRLREVKEANYDSLKCESQTNVTAGNGCWSDVVRRKVT